MSMDDDDYEYPPKSKLEMELPEVDFFGVQVEPRPVLARYFWNVPKSKAVYPYVHHHPYGCTMS